METSLKVIKLHAGSGVLPSDCGHEEFSGDPSWHIMVLQPSSARPWEFPEPERFGVAVRVFWRATEQGEAWKEGTQARRGPGCAG